MILLDITSIVFYLLATIVLWLSSVKNTGFTLVSSRTGLILGFIAVALHILMLYQTLNTKFGLNLGFYNAASLISSVIVLFVLVAALKKPVINLALFAMPMAIITIAFTLFFPGERLLGDDSFALEMHVLLSILAYSLLTIACLQACLLAYQEKRLRNKQPTRIMKLLPPLQDMETLLIEIIALGFFILSLSLVTGFVFLHDIFEQRLVHKTVLSILAWFLFATLLWGRWSKGWRGQTIMLWTIGGFTSLMLAYFGSKFVFELILHNQ